LEYIVNIISTLAWPVSIIVVVLILRHSIGKLISRVQSGEAFGVKLQFESQVEQLSGSIADLQLPARVLTRDTLDRPDYGRDLELRATNLINAGTNKADDALRSSIQIIGSSPPAAVLLSFNRLAIELKHLAAIVRERAYPKYTEAPFPVQIPVVVNLLTEEGLLNDATKGAITDLWNLAKKVREGATPSPHSAALYIEMVFRLLAMAFAINPDLH
jgi:hypothetical protein